MKRDQLQNQRGQAIVEMALVLPLIMLLLLGMVEIGRIGNAYLTVTHAARHGARHGAVGGTNDEIVTRVKNAASPLNPADLIIAINPAGSRLAGNDIMVAVSYLVQLITPIAGSFLSNPFIVKSEITMRIE